MARLGRKCNGDFCGDWYELVLNPRNRRGWAAWSQGEFCFPRKRDLKKQGQTGSDAGAPRTAQYSCMRKRGNPADETESPPPFSNEIRHAINDASDKINFVAAKRRLGSDTIERARSIYCPEHDGRDRTGRGPRADLKTRIAPGYF